MNRAAAAYGDVVRTEAARLLSWQDREPHSMTYGAFDRTYWAWKFTDFPGARYQEGVAALTRLTIDPAVETPLAGRPRAREWIRAGFRFWTDLQNGDGSFDEAYPHEHSLAATAFTGFYLGEAFLRGGSLLPDADQARIRRTLARAGRWLCRNDERHGVLSNHLAAAAAALHVMHKIAPDDAFDRRCRHFVRRIYDHQSTEGWYEEYGGADPGYQTHATFYLAWLWKSTGDAALLASLARSVDFLKHCIHPNGTLGGEYGSRNTEFYFPAGLEILAPALPDAAAIAGFMRPFVARQDGAGLRAMDAQNFLPMLNNYLAAAEAASEAAAAVPLPCQQEGEWTFEDAGLWVRSTSRYFAVVGLSKGGVVKAFARDGGGSTFTDCGYWARLSGGAVASSQGLSRQRTWQRRGPEVFVNSDFVLVNQRLLRPALLMAFRIFTLTLGRIPEVAYGLKNLLVHVLVKRRRLAPLRLRRRVRLDESGLVISDDVQAVRPSAVVELRRGGKFSSIHMGSSRYFQVQELEADGGDAFDRAPALRGASGAHEEIAWSPSARKGDVQT